MKPMYNGIAFSPDTTLSKTITSTDTTIYITNPNLLPDAPNYATIGTIEDTAETILYTGKTSTSLTGCTRGVEGTPIAWGAGEVIARNYTNKDHEAFIENINEKSNATNLTNGYGNASISSNSIADGDYSVALGKSNTTKGNCSIALGQANTTQGNCSIALGRSNTTQGNYSIALGYNNTSSGVYSFTEGMGTIAEGENTHAEGHTTTAKGKYSHVEGLGPQTETAAEASHAEGRYTQAIGDASHVEGDMSIAEGTSSHAEGFRSLASGVDSHAQNCNTIANEAHSTAIGILNKEMNSGDLFVIGNGISSSNRANAFRVDNKGNTYGLAAFQSTGADYAEYYLWVDQNPDNEDRVGLFVTFGEGSKIRIANANDNYILGVVSGNPSVIGNSYNDQWQGMYLKDHFDRIIYEEVDGKMQPKINPEYDPNKSFISRAKRPEWATIGTHGQLSVYDDGSCQVDGYCKAGDNGVATSAKKGVNTYRVIGRLTDNIIKIQIK